MADYVKIQKVIDYYFNDPSILKIAFTHSSFANENGVASNEKLEFFGDSILNMVISEFLFNNLQADEGLLSVARSSIVSEKPLATVIDRMGIIDELICGVGESRQKAKSDSIKSDLFEALVAAIYLDSGKLEEAEKFILTQLYSFINSAIYSVKNGGQEQPSTSLRIVPSKSLSAVKSNLPQKMSNVKLSIAQPDNSAAMQKTAKKEPERIKPIEHIKPISKQSGALVKPATVLPDDKIYKNQIKDKNALKTNPNVIRAAETSHAERTSPPVQKIEDFKSKLQVFVQKLPNQPKIEYKLLNTIGQAHKLTFVVACVVDGVSKGTGSALRKKEAEQIAAKAAFASFMSPH